MNANILWLVGLFSAAHALYGLWKVAEIAFSDDPAVGEVARVAGRVAIVCVCLAVSLICFTELYRKPPTKT